MEGMKFLILEQWDGRYVVVQESFRTSMGWDARAETIVRYEDDCRSTTKCYSEIAEYMVSSGSYLDYSSIIQFVPYKGQS